MLPFVNHSKSENIVIQLKFSSFAHSSCQDRYENTLPKMKKRLLPTTVLILYIAILIKVMVYKDLPTIKIGTLILKLGGTDGGHPANFVPFKTIVPYLFGSNLIISGSNLAGNIALLVPVGLLLPLVFKSINWKKALMLAVTAGLAIECLQVILRVGIFDVDDVILNALGVMVGYWSYKLLVEWIRTKNYTKIVLTGIAVLLLLTGMLYAIAPHGRQVNYEGATSQSGNLCGSTRGTGEILELGNSSITVKRNDNTNQTIRLTDRTVIKTSAGVVSQADLKVGDRVTLVVDDSETASDVLVCDVEVNL
jgi:glycopeptide antibiotics resistance protein